MHSKQKHKQKHKQKNAKKQANESNKSKISQSNSAISNSNANNNINTQQFKLYNDVKIIELLKDDIFLLDTKGVTCLHWLVRPRTLESSQNCYENVKYLLDFYKNVGDMIGAGTNAILHEIVNYPNKSEFGMFAMHHACHWQVVNKCDSKKHCFKASIEVIKLLLDNGANINELATYGRWTPLDYAIDSQRVDVIKYLRKHGGMTSNELHGIDTSDNEADFVDVYSVDSNDSKHDN